MNHQEQESLPYQASDEESAEFKNDFLQEKFQEILEKHPDLTVDQAFYFQYCKLYIETIKLSSQVEEAAKQIDKLKGVTDRNPGKVRKTLSQHLHNDTSNSERRKRVRRTANEIARHYVCRIQKCQKSYGSEGSLNQHMKLKHRQLFDGASGISSAEK